MVSKKDLIGILTGPTASGKSGLAVDLALKHPGIEIINADSVIVYRELDIGSAKPTRAETRGVPHHLIDIRSPDEPFAAGGFRREVLEAVDAIHSRGNRPLIVGGTGFYLKALTHGLWEAAGSDPEVRSELEEKTNDELFGELGALDPAAAGRIGRNDRYRLVRALEAVRLSGRTPSELERGMPREPDPRFRLWILDRRNDELEERVRRRAEAMIEAGLIEEVRRIWDRYGDVRPLRSVGYAQVCDYLDGIRPEGRKMREGVPGLIDEIHLATRQLVKRQRTWFRGQHEGEWFTLDEDRPALGRAFEDVYG